MLQRDPGGSEDISDETSWSRNVQRSSWVVNWEMSRISFAVSPALDR